MLQKITLPKPLEYQLDIINWLDDPNVKYVNFLKARQVGGSFLNKWLVSKWALENKKVKLSYITPTSKLSKLFHRELCQSLAPFITDSNKSDLIIEFNTGSILQFFSAEAENSIRGFQFHYVIIDEAAFMKEDVFNLIIRPTWTVIGRKIVFTSTPNGNNGFFYKQCQAAYNDEEGYRIKKVTIHDNPFISEQEKKLIKRQVPDRVWKQEYLGEFLDGSGTVFTHFKGCVGTPAFKGGRTYAGIDWAKKNDFTVVTWMNEHKEVLEIYRINTIDYTQQVKLIAAKLNKWKPYIVVSEENNIGAVVNELLKKAYTGKIKTPTLDNALKREIIENLIVAFETDDITIPDNEVLLRELQAFSCTYNIQTQTLKYSAPTGLHDDCVISLAYVYDAVKTKIFNPQIRII